MAHQEKKLAAFFGIHSLSVIRAENNEISYLESINHTFSPIQKPANNEQSEEGIRLTAEMQRIVRSQKISKPRINLSIPVRNVLFRSFEVPTMSPSELKGVVEFETRKYIPFEISDLIFGFQSIPIAETNNKKTLILLLAIRKSIFEQYCTVFEEAKFSIASAEPSSISLLRILASKKIIQPDEKIAIVQVNNDEGDITIIENQTPQFMRDFKLPAINAESPTESVKDLLDQLSDEIRTSLDFYTRQSKKRSNEHNIHNIYIFSNSYPNEIAAKITSDLNIPASIFDSNEILFSNKKININALSAFGASNVQDFSLNFDLDLAKARNPEAHGAKAGFKDYFNQPPDYKLTTKIGLGCIGLSLLIFSTTSLFGSPQVSKLKTLTEESKKYESLTKEQIQNQTKNISKKFNSYKNIRFSSKISRILATISDQTPDGAWLEDFSIEYIDQNPSKKKENEDLEETKIEIKLGGYGYAKKLNDQMTLVDAFMTKLRIHKDLKKDLERLELETVSKTERDGFPVTHFVIAITLNSTIDKEK